MSSYIVVLYVFLFYRQALELLYLFSEVETFYPLSPFLVSGLENWILKSPHQSPQNVLEWAPRESKVIWKLRTTDEKNYKKWGEILKCKTESELCALVLRDI